MTWLRSVPRPVSAPLNVTCWLAVIVLALSGCDTDNRIAHDASIDSDQVDAVVVPPDGATFCTTTAECDDGILCTVDSCLPFGWCGHVTDHEVCQNELFCDGRELCDALRGCIEGPRESCDDFMVCTIDRCDEATKRCVRMPRDLDEDGDVDFFCEGGGDCDDRDSSISGMTSELCDDFVDNDCDGVVDEPDCGRPPYDVCSNALEVTGSGSYLLNLVGATADYALGCLGTMPRQDLVVALTLDETQDVRVTAESDSFTTVLALRETCDSAAAELECRVSFPAVVARRALPAGTYYFIVTGFGTGEVALDVELSAPTEAPTNESCTAPIVIPPEGGHFEGSFVDVRDDHTVGCGSGSPDVVYTFTLATESDVTIAAHAPTGEALSWAVGTTCGSTVGEARCAYGTPASGTLHQLPAGTYFLVVEGPSYVEVEYGLDVTVGPPTPPQHGDVCADPIELTLGTPYSGTLSRAEDDIDTSCGYHYREMVHVFTITEPSDVTIVVDGGSAYMNASLRTTCGDGSTQLRCDTGVRVNSRLRGMAPGTYYLVVEAGRGGAYTVTVSATSPPSTPTPVTGNDTCGGAFSIPETGGLFSGSTATAVGDYTTTLCGNMATSNDVAFRLDLSSRSLVTATTDGSTFDTVLYYYTGSCGGGRTESACDDDGGSGSTSLLSRVLEPGTYFFIVDGYGTGNAGNYVLEVLISPP